MTVTITIQGYGPGGLFVRATHCQDTFADFDAVKTKANELWKEFKAPDVPYLQMFILDIEKQKNVFYHASFR